MYETVEERKKKYKIVDFKDKFGIYKDKKLVMYTETEEAAHEWIEEDIKNE
jgi:hypothetical protein